MSVCVICKLYLNTAVRKYLAFCKIFKDMLYKSGQFTAGAPKNQLVTCNEHFPDMCTYLPSINSVFSTFSGTLFPLISFSCSEFNPQKCIRIVLVQLHCSSQGAEVWSINKLTKCEIHQLPTVSPVW